MMQIVLLFSYFVLLSGVLLYSLFQLQLLYFYLKSRKKIRKGSTLPTLHATTPFVTIQLPIYNELYVVERLLDNISRMDYPREQFEIQVLDDSTDETADILKRKVKELADSGLNIDYLHRSDRCGFKAGALKHGLCSAKGEFIAIFDADFLPEPDFLQNTIPYFSDRKIGAIQTRWGHVNKKYSLLTRLQAFALDAHFTIEQSGRNSQGFFINFNGTAGVWRKDTILDAGNWEGDTLTEDLDLSYRAQLKGWKFKYLEDVVSPAELPIAVDAIKLQQFRWIKGGTQNFLKFFRKVISAPIPLLTKVNALFYLFSSMVFVFTFSLALLSFPVMLFQSSHPELKHTFAFSAVYLLTPIILIFYYGIAFFKTNRHPRSVFIYPVYFLLFLIFVFGLSLNNFVAVMEALFGIKVPFSEHRNSISSQNQIPGSRRNI